MQLLHVYSLFSHDAAHLVHSVGVSLNTRATIKVHYALVTNYQGLHTGIYYIRKKKNTTSQRLDMNAGGSDLRPNEGLDKRDEPDKEIGK